MTTRQLRRTLFIEGFGTSGISFAYLALTGGNSGFYAILLYGVLLFLLSLYLFCVSKIYTDKTTSPFSNIGKILGTIFLLRTLIHACFLIWIFVSSIHEIYMEKQPIFLIVLPLSLVLWYLSITTFQKKGRFLELIFPWIFIPFLIMLVTACFYPAPNFTPEIFSFAQFRFTDFQTSFLLLLCSTPIEFLFFLFPKTKQAYSREAAFRHILIPIFAIFLANIALWFFTIRIIGAHLATSTPWSIVKLIQLIHLPGGFLLRIDILLMMYWIFCMLSIISSYLFYGNEIFATCFSFPKSKLWLPILPLSLMLFYSLRNQPDFLAVFSYYITYKKYIDFPLLLISPLFILANAKRHSKTLPKLLSIFLITCILTGCSASIDIEDKAYISSMYITTDSEKYTFTLTENVLESQEETEEYVPSKIITLQADSFSSLQKSYEKHFSKTLEWNHIETIFLSDKLCSDKEKLCTFLTDWDQNWQCSPDVNLILTNHSAKEIFHLKSLPKGASGQECNRMIKRNTKRISTIAKTPIDYLKLLNSRTNTQKSYIVFIKNNQLVLVVTNFLQFP